LTSENGKAEVAIYCGVKQAQIFEAVYGRIRRIQPKAGPVKMGRTGERFVARCRRSGEHLLAEAAEGNVKVVRLLIEGVRTQIHLKKRG
jgi:hypothetical protein